MSCHTFPFRHTRIVRHGLLAGLLAAMSSAVISADTPTLEITAPSGTVYLASFPSLQSLSLKLTHNELDDVNVFRVFVNGVSLIDSNTIGNPFDSSNACRAQLAAVTSSCVTNGLDQATIVVPWNVPGPGTYTVTTEVRHGGQGREEEAATIVFALITVEYPAPPAIANAYINRTYGARAGAKTRGCVINQVAEQHAKYERYGPKGGPYNDALVYSDVQAYWGPCSTQ